MISVGAKKLELFLIEENKQTRNLYLWLKLEITHIFLVVFDYFVKLEVLEHVQRISIPNA
jgi:hypothetical protein